jgi:hypothetical protein
MQVALLVIGALIGCLVLSGVTVRRPAWGLILGAIIIYNPIFNYRFLFTHEFEGGSARATLSIAVLACLYIGIVVNRSRDPEFRISMPHIPWQVSYVVWAFIGAALGLIGGHDLRLVVADLFPVVEFAAFFPLVALTCRSRVEASRLAVALLIWGSIVAAIEVGLYIVAGDQFVSRFAFNGGATLIHRLDDFIPALFLPLGVALAVQCRHSYVRVAAIAASTALTAATILSFFRSLWVGLFAALIVMLWIWFGSSIRLISFTRGLAVRLGVGAAIVVVVVGTLSVVKVSSGLSAMSLLISRMTHIESTSGSARIDDNRQLIQLFQEHPLGIGLGGMSPSGYPLFSTSDYYLSTAVELGIVGLLLIVAMTVTFVRRNYMRFRTESRPLMRGIVSGTIGSYVCMAVTLLTFPSLLHYPITAFLAILGGVAAVVGQQPVGSESPAGDGDRRPAGQRRVGFDS